MYVLSLASFNIIAFFWEEKKSSEEQHNKVFAEQALSKAVRFKQISRGWWDFTWGFNQITRRQILDSSKLKEFADDNFKLDEKLSKRVKTLWEKEKLLFTSNFSFSHSVFRNLVSQGRQKVPLCGNGLNSIEDLLISYE